jgi:hypothetical protein
MVNRNAKWWSSFPILAHNIESVDMDCGSAPYMSYGMFNSSSVDQYRPNEIGFIECRNNVAATSCS